MHQWNDSYFVIYNEQELNNTFGPFTKGVSQEHPTLSFSQAPLNNSKIIITYGIRSQYILGYGFQKVDKSFSDSVRLMDTDNTSPKILDESNGELSALTFENSSLFISLDDSDEKTILKLFNVPLLYSPELNITFTFDHLILDLLDSFGNDFNNLAIEFKYITNDGYYEFYSDPLIIPLNYSEISSNIIDNTYAINYNKDLQAIYDMVGADSVDIEIIVHQSGKSSNYIPYIILNQYDYLSDTHLVETYDRMPINKYCNLDINSVITTPHYFQIFSRPFVDGAYGDSPFNLFDGSQVTIALTDLPNSTLVSLDSNGGENYNFNYWGTSKTLSVSEDNFYMIRNLGMFIDTYNIDETLYQDGYLDLYYGSGTEIDGEKQYINNIFMDYAGVSVEDYTSASSYNVPTSWNNTYDFTNKFLTTDAIKVEGQVFYHQIFDLETDLNSSSVINDIFPNYENDIYFGLQLTSNFDIDEIRAVSKPYFYSLSVQGFPTGKYKENYCSIQSTSSGDFDPTPKLIDEDYALDYDEDVLDIREATTRR